MLPGRIATATTPALGLRPPAAAERVAPVSVTIDHRFNGPPETANGGWTAGRLAGELGVTSATVRLLRPPPLGRPLDVVRGDGEVQLRDGDGVLATAWPDRLDLDPQPPVPVAEASAAACSYPGAAEHPYADCFVCGPARRPGDGMRVFAGRIGAGRVAGVWVPGGDMVRPEFVWAALDCPTAFAVDGFDETLLLGTITASVDALPHPGEPHVVVGWEIGREGRKRWTGGALYDPAGRLLARSRLTWIVLRREPAAAG